MAGFRPDRRGLLVALPPVVAVLWLWVAYVEDLGTREATVTAVVAAACLCVFSVAEDAWEHWHGRRREGAAGGDRDGEA
ncbi:hypothetical protein HW130_09675 [Streptomyces sp. PKU-EA00015]|uniref:hypothetical protein n=1 Tax=Streptomyces sp. PKU-EA00015 TaxID=2748326 RepID=UPI0015A3C740|nr:hypothetical protein [Streptomyces sp. PKU-EA00015]NWF26539.1 hypothetical protein [Streptomyces sp. PKU-EA00015]